MKKENKEGTRDITAKEFKLLTDIIWGWDLGKMSWMLTEEEAKEVVEKYKNFITPIFKNRKAVTGEEFSFLVGYALIAPLNLTEKELIDKERSCSHIENWDINGSIFYLSEIAIHQDYRCGGKTFLKLIKKTIEYCKKNNIDYLYTTAVSDDSRMLLKNKKLQENIDILAIKEENRQVAKIKIKDLD